MSGTSSGTGLPSALNRPFFRFLLVGVFNTIVGLSVIAILLNVVQANYWVATFVGNGVGALVSYMLNKRFTFRSNASVFGSLWKFFAVTLVCYGLSYGAGLVFSRMIAAAVPAIPASYVEDIAALLGTGLYTVSNFLGHKYFTFRSNPHSRQAGEVS